MTNCPPVYRNLECESFGNKRKITAQLLRQFCKNDAYLYEQIMALWDTTDPESRKRFYPPDFMDVGKSFGIESYILSIDERAEFYNWSRVYRFSNNERINYIFDFDSTNDRVDEFESNGTTHLHDGSKQYINVYADSLLDFEGNYDGNKLEIVNENGEASLRPTLAEDTYEEIINHKAQYSYVTAKNEKLGKAKKDAYFYGAYKNWHCNNFWYSGFDRTKNYHIKSKWKKDPYSEDKDIVKKYGRIPSVCHAQTFKAQNTGRLNKVSMNVKGSKNSVSPCIVEIRTTTKKGYPTEEVLARTEKKFNNNAQKVIAFEFKNKAKIEKGKTYAIVMRSPFSHFENTYRWGGWTKGCFSSASKYYSQGSAFTSTDNGKTWIKNGKTKDTKSYGSHYYDWGINQTPVDLSFEVYVQPITQNASKKKISASNNIAELIAKGYTHITGTKLTYRKLKKAAYNEKYTYSFSYFKAGSYYLHLRPIQTNPIDKFTITDTFTDETHDSAYWKWEYFDIKNSKWVEIDSNGVNFNNTVSNYTVLKLRIRCDITQSTLGSVVSNEAGGESSRILNDLINTNKLRNTTLTYLKRTVITVDTIKPTDAYLRTHYYHPPKTDMLGANIWSEVNAKAKPMGDAKLEIDIIHEKEVAEHFRFYDLNNLLNVGEELTSKQQDMISAFEDYINEYTNKSDVHYSALQIIQFILNDFNNDGSFISFLANQMIPVYILPFTYDYVDYFFFNKIELSQYPAYPLVGGDVGDDDIIICTSETSNSNIFTRASNYGFAYKLDTNIKKTLSSIEVIYDTDLEVSSGLLDSEDEDTDIVDEEGYELNEQETIEHIEERLKGIFLATKDDDVFDNTSGNTVKDIFTDDSVDYALTDDGLWIIFNSRSPMIRELFPNRYDATLNGSNELVVTLKPNGNYDFTSSLSECIVKNFQLKIDLSSKTYQEFVDFQVDYANKILRFYNTNNLVEGDFKITYNPLWVRGLSIADFPLKMDLWKEQYKVVTDGIYKQKFNTETGYWEDDTLYNKTNKNPYTNELETLSSYYQFKTTVPPLDNIRKLVINEGVSGKVERTLYEDSEYFVDYLTNTVTLYISDINVDDTITIHYTPNLTDNGLALGYRLKRPRYKKGVLTTDDDLTGVVNDTDDVYIGMNYFTYRT